MVGFDLMQILTSILTMIGNWVGFIILFGIVVIGLVYIWMINNRYPKVKVLLFDRGSMIFTDRRRVGDMLVKADLPQLMFNTDRLIGEDIKKFTFVRYGKDRVYLAMQGPADVLVPMQIDTTTNRIFSEAVLSGRQVATEYVTLHREAKNTVQTANPLITGILTVLPLAIVILIASATFVSLLDYITKQYVPMTAIMQDIVTKLDILVNRTGGIPATNTTQNIVYG